MVKYGCYWGSLMGGKGAVRGESSRVGGLRKLERVQVGWDMKKWLMVGKGTWATRRRGGICMRLIRIALIFFS